MSHSDSHSSEHEEFSLSLFAFTILVSFGILLAGLRFIAPDAWAAQFLSTPAKGLAAFAVLSLLNCFVEFFFHRYVLHTSAVPFLRYLYKQHTLHHALTRITRRQRPGGHGILVIENKFPIVEPEQGEASFFPWYSMGVFALIYTPGLILLQWLFPSFPWFLSGYAALGVSLSLYEVLHAINHWAFEVWAPLLESPRWSWFWRPVYGFHLRHHAVIDCNESISGFFGLPVADWVFRTCIIPKTVYADGEASTPEAFASPSPVWPIRKLDAWAHGAVKARRAAETQSDEYPQRKYSRGEEIANWVTHGVGLAASAAALALLIVFASLRGDAWHVVSFTVFGLALLGVYTVSTVRQALRHARVGSFFRRLEPVAFILLVGGTYTPFLLTNLRGPLGWTFFGVIWGLCGAGAVFQLLFSERYRLTTSLACLSVGWLLVLILEPVIAAAPAAALWLLVAGGLCYGLGLLFRKWQRIPYHRALWHSFVLGGGTCHLLLMIIFLLPRAS